MAKNPAKKKNAGLGFWMEQVLKLHGRTLAALSEENVHDLRVALRRCRSMVQTVRQVDEHRGWKKINREARTIFRALGDLRDTQVQILWVEELRDERDPLADRLRERLLVRERELQEAAAGVLQGFDRKRWEKWRAGFPARIEKIAADVVAFEELALRRLDEVDNLDTLALRERDEELYHELRIAVKRLRYVAENFLPGLYARSGKELKRVQDLLGEAHDLCVLRESLIELAGPGDAEQLAQWKMRLSREYTRRIRTYRRMAVGAWGVWGRWRSMLTGALQAS